MSATHSIDGNYTIRQTLSSEGPTTLYKAYDASLQREVAIKRINHTKSNENSRRQLLRETRVLGALRHPNIVSIYDVENFEKHDHVIMEWVNGVNVAELMKRHLLTASDFKSIATQVLYAIQAAHQVGVLHCNLVPKSLMLNLTEQSTCEAKLLNFGTSGDGEVERLIAGSSIPEITYFMAPELFDGEAASEQTDLYALGCLFYYMLTGLHPFEGKNTDEVIAAHKLGHHTMVSVIRRDLDPVFGRWIESLIAKDPEVRVGDCQEAIEGLSRQLLPFSAEKFEISPTWTLKSSNSGTVRQIVAESLRPEKPVTNGISSSVTAVVTSTVSSRIKGAKPLREARDQTTAAVVPVDAEWYFTIAGVTKGPVSLEHLRKLCDEGRFDETSVIWKPDMKDWVAPYECPETMDLFVVEDEESKHDFEQESQNASWFGSEVLIVLLCSIIGVCALHALPGMDKWVIFSYAAVIFVVGYVSLRLNQYRSGKLWFALCVILPFVGDLVFAIAQRNARATICTVMFLLGGSSAVLVGAGELKESHAEFVATDVKWIDFL